MTRKEAIEVLNMVEAHGLADEAKQMAIQALTDNSCYSCKYYFHGRCKKANVTWSDITQCEFYEALQAQAEKTCDLEKSNFSKEQYKLDTDTAYECGYNAGLQAQGEQLISKRAVLDAVEFEDRWLFDAKSHNPNTKIAFSGIYHSINKLPTWVEAEVVIEHSGFLKYIAENMNPNEYQNYYNQYYHTTDEKVGGQHG